MIRFREISPVFRQNAAVKPVVDREGIFKNPDFLGVGRSKGIVP